MKITNKQYALSLYEQTKGKSETEVQAELANFVLLLASHNAIGRADAILAEFEKSWQQGERIVEATVTSADKLEAETLKTLESYISAETGAVKVSLKHHVDQKMLAGFVLRFGDQILDGSALKMISNLKKVLIK
jgi:F-type H+-transporting ATPase subunit O